MERQDLIVPPSGRLPAEKVRIAKEKEPPRITALRGTGSHLSKPDLRPENVEGAIPAELASRARDLGPFIDREATKELRGLGKKWAENANVGYMPQDTYEELPDDVTLTDWIDSYPKEGDDEQSPDAEPDPGGASFHDAQSASKAPRRLAATR